MKYEYEKEVAVSMKNQLNALERLDKDKSPTQTCQIRCEQDIYSWE